MLLLDLLWFGHDMNKKIVDAMTDAYSRGFTFLRSKTLPDNTKIDLTNRLPWLKAPYLA